MRFTVLEPAFVEYVPSSLSPGVLYLALEHSTVVHLCACGCRTKVVTPLSPAQWRLTFDGDAVSLWPSIGNWQFPCRSHYWIRGNAVVWAASMTDAEVADLRRQDAAELQGYFAHRAREVAAGALSPSRPARRRAWWRQQWARLLKRRWSPTRRRGPAHDEKAPDRVGERADVLRDRRVVLFGALGLPEISHQTGAPVCRHRTFGRCWAYVRVRDMGAKKKRKKKRIKRPGNAIPAALPPQLRKIAEGRRYLKRHLHGLKGGRVNPKTRRGGRARHVS